MVRCQHNKSVSRSSQKEPISVKQAGKAAYLSWMQMPDLASAGLWHRGGKKIQVSTTNWCQSFKEEIFSDVWSVENVDTIISVKITINKIK